MKQTPNSRRLAETAREIIANILVTEVSDPRLEFVTVTGAEVSPDRSWMSVYVSTTPTATRRSSRASTRPRAAFARCSVQSITWRVTPELRFFIDESVDSGMRMEEALRAVPPSLVAERAAEETSPAEDSDADDGAAGEE